MIHTESERILFNFSTLFNYSKIRTPQGLLPTVPPDFGTAEIHNCIKRKRAFEVSILPRKPLFYAFFGGFDPGEGFSFCIKISRNIDPACGSGSLLIRALAEVPFEISGYGQEKESSTAGLAKMNAVLHNKATIKIMAGNTFSDPQFIKNEDSSELERFDYIVANPPFSLKNWSDGLKEYGRFSGYGDRPPEKNGDYAWLMHILKTLKSTGKAAVILPHGVLFRGNAEGTIRQAIVDKGWIKGIISLPPNLFYGTGIPACIIIIDKEGAENRSGIFMIDAGK